MVKQQNQLYEFGIFRLDAHERLLTRENQQVPLTPKAFDVLMMLISRGGHLISKEEIMSSVWRDSIVEDGNLVVTISMLRKALGEDSKYIQTVSKQGYRFVGEVRQVAIPDDVLPPTVIHPEAIQPKIAEPEITGPVSTVIEIGPPPAKPRLGIRQVFLALGILFAGACVAGVLFVWNRPHFGNSHIQSVAVLPLGNLTGDTQNDYLGLGIADAVITALGSTGQVIVRPTTAVFKYDMKSADPVTAGREQEVDAVLDGRIQASAGRIQVTVRLIRVSDGSSLWVGAFEENQRPVFTVQAISDSIARSIIQELPGKQKEPLAHRNTKNTKAYQLYLQGRYFWDQRSEEGIRRSLSYFQQAIAEDPDYALAYSGMADCYTRLSAYSLDPAKLTAPLAKASALRALQLDSSLAEVHASLGFISFNYDWNWKSAEQEFQRSLSLDPSYNASRHWYADTLAVLGRLEESLNQAKRAEQQDPMSPITHADLGHIFYLSRRYDEAIASDHRALELDPNFGRARTNLVQAYLQTGAFNKAFDELKELQRLSNAHLTGMMGRGFPELLGYAQGLAGNRAAARQAFQEMTDRVARQNVARLFGSAQLCIGLGDSDCAIEWLTRAYEAHDPAVAYAKTDPSLDPMRSDPRFKDLIKRFGF